ncbi:WYL domain-containing protein, partial [Actinacidiphila rubida]
ARPADASGRVTVGLPVESEEVAFAQLVGLGADAEVLAPESLRARFRAHARGVAGLYSAQDPTDQR